MFLQLIWNTVVPLILHQLNGAVYKSHRKSWCDFTFCLSIYMKTPWTDSIRPKMWSHSFEPLYFACILCFYHQRPILYCFVYSLASVLCRCFPQIQFSKSACPNEPILPWYNVTFIYIRQIRSYSAVSWAFSGYKRSAHLLLTDDASVKFKCGWKWTYSGILLIIRE